MFLKKSNRKDFSTTDITISNWKAINQIGSTWITLSENESPDLTLGHWHSAFPSIDLWLEVDESQIHYVSHILPTLDWDGGLLGVRLILEPKDTEKLNKAYTDAYLSAKETRAAHKKKEAQSQRQNCKR